MTGETSFSAFLGEHLRAQREELVRQWVETIADQLNVPDGKVLPSEDLLNHMPRVLENVAAFVADPGNATGEKLVVQDLGDLAELRRRQGFELGELLREFQLLADLLRRSVEEAAGRYDRSVPPTEVIAVVGRLLDAIHSFGSVTARSYGAWRERYESERKGLLETYGQVINHELSNRLGAAETAVQLLLSSSMDVAAEKRRRLLELVLDGIRGGMETIRDVSVLTHPLSEQWEAPGIPLPLIVRETVRLARAMAEESAISVALVGDVPGVRVAGPPMKIALSNLVSNALKFSADDATDPWVRISAKSGADGTVEVVVEDNGPGISDDAIGRVFEYRYRGDVEEEGSGLGLAVSRDALERVGGAIRAEIGSEGGARFVITVPTLDAE